jgi:prepilin-type N-terminal cleavage/methylation domain-containing protein
MRRRQFRRANAPHGFTLVELAVVVAIVALLLGTLMYTLSAQTDQRNFEETRRRLDSAHDLLLAYAIANGRLPCPATATSNGYEDPVGGATCTIFSAAAKYSGWLPAVTIGFQQVDSSGYAIDAWGNRIRYAVSFTNTGCATTPPANTLLFTNASNLKTYGISCQPNDLVVCKSATGTTPSSCGPATNSLTNQQLVVAVVLSMGKNGAIACSTCTDQNENTDGDPVFIYHTLTPAGATNGEFDDQMVWIPVGELYSRLIGAGVLP